MLRKNFVKRISFICLLLVIPFFIISCKDDSGDIIIDPDGGVRPGEKEANITFWGYGDQDELAVFRGLVDSFNALYKDVIKVNYIQKSPDSYGDALKLGLQGSKGPDVVYVPDDSFKALATLGYLLPLDSYIEESTKVNIEDMWESSINRYLYDVDTTTSTGPNAKYWGIPKDIGPTVIYYNETFFKTAGVTVISVSPESLSLFNGGEKDSRGATKSDYQITGEVLHKGYQVINGKKVFNNQIAMNWEETVECARVVQQGSPANYGFHTEWWFNYGWSVGGDCIEYIPSNDTTFNGGYYTFSLMDPTPNFIVYDDNGFDIGANHYAKREIISWYDKLVSPTTETIKPEILAAVTSGKLKKLPSQRDAFVEFIRLGQSTTTLVDNFQGNNQYGYGVTPSPTSIGGDSGKTKAFANGNVAMLVDGRWNVTNFRKQMQNLPGTPTGQSGNKYEWDVAPLPVYREYDSNGSVEVEGLSAGHSGSVALSINAKTSKPSASFIFLEYIGGEIGQLEQAKSGFAIPSQRHLAATEDFLQTNQNPRNSIIFLDAAKNQTPGDWWYLMDKAWIDPWAGLLNGDVRNGKITLSQFYSSNQYNNTFDILKTYTKKNR
ncbi:MAG: extracellular solute-binding protein [Acholeplasmatales bacterium]|jgi:multiple sugar transport system substrate-binding protein|nr:extracellular solute-binding protein [Acholeplasmatales bacterium]